MSSCGGNSGSSYKCGMKRTARGDSSFNRLRDENEAVAKNEEHALSLMTDRVLKDSERKAHERLLLPSIREKTRMQRKNLRMKEQAGEDPSAVMPRELKKKVMELQGRDVKMVIEKVLTKTDLDVSCNRLSIPKEKKRVEFLIEEEQANIVQKKEDGLHFQGKRVSLIEPNLEVSKIWLEKWKVGNNGMSYMLSSPWISVANSNGLIIGDKIQLWSFRVYGSLWFALIKLNN